MPKAKPWTARGIIEVLTQEVRVSGEEVEVRLAGNEASVVIEVARSRFLVTVQRLS